MDEKYTKFDGWEKIDGRKKTQTSMVGKSGRKSQKKFNG